MSTLTGKQVKDTYKDLLHLGNSNSGLTSNTIYLSSGDGTESSLGLSTSTIGIKGHILPDANAQYDLGSAEYKIRHLFLSDNSLHVGNVKMGESYFANLSTFKFEGGNVGIGNVNPAYNLDVTGNINVTGRVLHGGVDLLDTNPTGGLGANYEFRSGNKVTFPSKLPDEIILSSGGAAMAFQLAFVSDTTIAYYDKRADNKRYTFNLNGTYDATKTDTTYIPFEGAGAGLQDIIDGGHAVYHGQKPGTDGVGSLSALQVNRGDFYTDLPDAIVAQHNGDYECVLHLTFADSAPTNGLNFFYEASYDEAANVYGLVFDSDLDGSYSRNIDPNDPRIKPEFQKSLRWFIENGRAVYYGSQPKASRVGQLQTVKDVVPLANSIDLPDGIMDGDSSSGDQMRALLFEKIKDNDHIQFQATNSTGYWVRFDATTGARTSKSSNSNGDFNSLQEYITNGQALYYGGLGGMQAGGVSTFVGLEDTPVSLVSDKILKTNSTGDAIEFTSDLSLDSVGIGTTNPSANLTIQNEGSDTPMQGGHLVDIKSTGNSKLADIRLEAIDSTGATRAGGIGFNADDNVIYLANNGEQILNVNNNGNVGIGTNNPSANFEIKGGSEPFTIYDLNDEKKLRTFTSSSGAVLALTDGGNDIIRLDGRSSSPNDSYFMGGNVGIGNDTPAYELDVTGDINLTGTIRKNGADVFSAIPDGGAGDLREIQKLSNFNGKIPDQIMIKYKTDVGGMIFAFRGIMDHSTLGNVIMYHDEYNDTGYRVYFNNDATGTFNELMGNYIDFYEGASPSLQDLIDNGNAVFHGQKSGTSGSGSLSLIKTLVNKSGNGGFYTELPDVIYPQITTADPDYYGVFYLDLVKPNSGAGTGSGVSWEAIYRPSNLDMSLRFNLDHDGTLQSRTGFSSATTSTLNNLRWYIENGAAAYLGGQQDYGIKAWGKFDGTGSNGQLTFTGGNVSSVEKISTGKYKVTFANPLPHADYAVSGSVNPSGFDAAYFCTRNFGTEVPTTQSFYIEVRAVQTNGGFTDSDHVSFQIVY